MLQKLEYKIDEFAAEIDDQIILAEKVIEIIIKSLAEIKITILEKGFTNTEEEIHFFKVLKPKFVSKLIYYNAIYKIEAKKPYGGERVFKKYLNQELSKLKRFFDNNLDFYKYYRTSSSYLDHKYFIRGKYDIKLSLDTYYFETDHSFATSHDYKVSKIIANDLIQVYLEDLLSNIDRYSSFTDKGKLKPSLQWTSSKTSLIELIYALYAEGVFDNGKTDIKEIAKKFESMFSINLGDFYHTYLELRNRKTNRTKFLDLLRESLIKKMDDQDEKED